MKRKLYLLYDAIHDIQLHSVGTLEEGIGFLSGEVRKNGYRQMRVSMEPHRVDIFSMGIDAKLLYTIEMKEAKNEGIKVRGRPSKQGWNKIRESKPPEHTVTSLATYLSDTGQEVLKDQFVLSQQDEDGKVIYAQILPDKESMAAEIFSTSPRKSLYMLDVVTKWVDGNVQSVPDIQVRSWLVWRCIKGSGCTAMAIKQV